MSISLLIAGAAAVWLLSIGAAILSLSLSLCSRFRRAGASLLSACVALGTAWFGSSTFHLSGFRTVNGHTQWHLDSKWFFMAALILAAVSLAIAVWNWRTSGQQGSAIRTTS